MDSIKERFLIEAIREIGKDLKKIRVELTAMRKHKVYAEYDQIDRLIQAIYDLSHSVWNR